MSMDRQRLGFAMRSRIYMNIRSAGRARGEICSFLQSLRFPLNVSMILIIAYFRIICCWKFEHIPLEKEGEYMDIQNVQSYVWYSEVVCQFTAHSPAANLTGWSCLPIRFKREIETLWLGISKGTVAFVINKFFSNPFSCFHQFCMVSAFKSNFSFSRTLCIFHRYSPISKFHYLNCSD